MEKEQTTPISARIPLSLLAEIHKELEETNQNMSDFIEKAIKDRLFNYCNQELLDSEIAYHKQIIQNLERKKEESEEKEKTLLKIPKSEIQFLLKTKKIIEDNPLYCIGRINLYKNKFNKHYRISEQDFFKLLRQAEDQAKANEILGKVGK